MKNMAQKCPECGAAFQNGLNCWEQLAAIGAWEFQDPELFALHFFTVASYNLQHPAKFTEEVLKGLQALYIKAFDNGWSNEEVRRQANYDFAQFNGKKGFKSSGKQTVCFPLMGYYHCRCV